MRFEQRRHEVLQKIAVGLVGLELHEVRTIANNLKGN